DCAVGLAVADGGSIGAWRGIHEDVAALVIHQTVEDARGSIALQPPTRNLAQPAFGNELAHRRDAFDPRRKAAIARDSSLTEFEFDLGSERERNIEAVGRQEAGRAIWP